MKSPALALVAALLSAISVAAQDAVAIKAGKLITISGPPLENAVILIENGKIKAIGKELKPAWNARVIDASDKTVMPTYVLAHTSGGLSSGDTENMPNVPYLTVQDAVDPASTFFEEALRNGIGTIHVVPGNRTLIAGQGMVVRPYGKTVEDMAVQTRSALKMSLQGQGGSRIAQLKKLRRALEDVREYMKEYERKKAEFAQEKAAGASGDKKEFSEEIEFQKKPIVDLLNKKLGAFLYVPGAAELPEALRIPAEFQFRATLVLGAQCHKAVPVVAATRQTVVLDDDLEFYEQEPDSEVETLVCPPALMHKAGVVFALSIDTNVDSPRRYPWWQMATAIRHGVDRESALKALTLVPAQILGLADQFGSVEEGKVANLQILSGDPLKATTWVETVLLEGQVVYERSKDRRLQYVTGKQDPKAAESK